MLRRKNIKYCHLPVIVLMAIFTLFKSDVHAGGLRCSVGEVVMENLKIGRTYSLKTLANLPLSVTNTGPKSVTVLIEPIVPASTETKQGAEPIPGVSWAKALPDSFELAPQETRAVEMILSIPDKEAYLGKKFQVNFWSHTLAKDGEFLAYGLSSRVIFTIDSVRPESNIIPEGELSFSILPTEMRFKNLTPGVVHNLEDLLDKPLVIRNTSKRKLTVELKPVRLNESAASAPEGYADLMESAEINLSASTFYLDPGEEKLLTGTICFNKEVKSSSKNFMGIICAAVIDRDIKTQTYTRIYAYLK